jgi:hypothetical protein
LALCRQLPVSRGGVGIAELLAQLGGEQPDQLHHELQGPSALQRLLDRVDHVDEQRVAVGGR